MLPLPIALCILSVRTAATRTIALKEKLRLKTAILEPRINIRKNVPKLQALRTVGYEGRSDKTETEMDTERLLTNWTEMANTAVQCSRDKEKLTENAATTGASLDGEGDRQLRQAVPRSLRGRTVTHSRCISKRVHEALSTVPRQLYAVVWFVKDHARGEVFESLVAAQESYDEKDGGLWALRLYDANGEVISQFGTLQDSRWSELDRWRIEHVLSAVAPPQCEEFCDLDAPASDVYDLTCPDIQTARMLATMSLEDPDMSMIWCCRRQRVWIRKGARQSHPTFQPGTPNRGMITFYRRTPAGAYRVKVQGGDCDIMLFIGSHFIRWKDVNIPLASNAVRWEARQDGQRGLTLHFQALVPWQKDEYGRIFVNAYENLQLDFAENETFARGFFQREEERLLDVEETARGDWPSLPRLFTHASRY